MSTHILVEDFPAIRLQHLRKAARGRKRFNQSSHCTVDLADGRSVRVDLLRTPTNLGHLMTLPICPTCRRLCRVLRVVPFEPGLACARDLKEIYNARFESQVRQRTLVKEGVLVVAESQLQPDGW